MHGEGGTGDPVRRIDEIARTKWFGRAGRLLQHHRESCADAAFDALADRLALLPDLDAELLNRVAHERCLAFLERWRPSDAETALDGWKPTGDPVWFGRRASLLAEFEWAEAIEAIDEMLLAVRLGLAAAWEPDGIHRTKTLGIDQNGKRRLDCEQIRIMHASGEAPAAIAKALGYSRMQVYRMLHESHH